jgi:hypothetical protein
VLVADRAIDSLDEERIERFRQLLERMRLRSSSRSLLDVNLPDARLNVVFTKGAVEKQERDSAERRAVCFRIVRHKNGNVGRLTIADHFELLPMPR